MANTPVNYGKSQLTSPSHEKGSMKRSPQEISYEPGPKMQKNASFSKPKVFSCIPSYQVILTGNFSAIVI